MRTALFLPIVALCILSSPLEAEAQLDTEFWFVAPEIWANHGDAPILLRFSTLDEAADVTVDQPANPGFPAQSLSIPATGTATLDLTAWLGIIENKPSNQVLTKGLRIVSTAPISVYYEVNHSLNTDIFTLKGDAALGTQFYAPFQNNLTNNFTQSTAGIDVIATTDGTEVTVVPTENLNGHPAGVAFSFTLNAGETYGMRASATNGPGHPSGTLITSNHPIAVTVSDDSVLNGACWDMMGDQIIPASLAGEEHIAVKGNLSGPDKVYLVATEDGTTVSVNGNLVTGLTLNTGETFSHNLTGTTGYYETSAPVIALHLTGFGCEVGQAILPPISCTGSNEVAFVRSTSEFFGMKIIVPSGGEGDFLLNGSAANVGAGAFSDVPGTGGAWKYANITATGFIPTGGASRIENESSKFHLGIINGGAASGTRYGFFSAFTQFEHETFVTDDNLCEGELAELYCSPILGATYDWQGPNGFTDSGDAISFGPITMADTGLYIVSGIVNGCEILPDTLALVINEQPGTPSVMAMTDLCEGDDWNWVALTEADEWNWLDADGNVLATDSVVNWSGANLSDAGSYSLVVSTNDCASAAATFNVVVNETVIVGFDSPTESACAGGDWTLSPDQAFPGALWTWTLPDGSEIDAEELTLSPVAASDAGTYTLGGSNNGCPMVSDAIELDVVEPVGLVISAPAFVCSADAPIDLTTDDTYSGNWTSVDCTDCLSNSGNFDAQGAAAGNIEVTYNSSGPCATSVSAIIEVILTPSSNFSDFTACEGQGEVLMIADEAGGTWNAECGTCADASGLFDTELAGVGNWQVTYSIDGLCPISSNGSFTVTPNLSSAFALPSSLCTNAPVVELTPDVSGGEWLASCSNCLSNDGDFDASEAGSGSLDILYTIPGACGSSTTQSILIIPLPDANFEFATESSCAPATIICSAPVNPDATDCQWSYSQNGSTVSFDCNSSTFEIPEGGCFELSHTVYGNTGCTNTAQAADLLCLNSPPEANFQTNPANPSLFDEFMTLTASGANTNHNYDWDIGGAIQTNGIEVEVQLNTIGSDQFEVCLEVTDELSCTAIECRSISLDEGITAYAPNAFSPDQDGRNDAWKIVCNDAVKSFELHIFDRWGNLVFETQDKHDFWMGDVKGGTHFASNGIYFYRAVLRGDNYEVRSMEGSIALIR